MEEEEEDWAVHVPEGPHEQWLTTKPIALSGHALQRAAERFGLARSEVEAFILGALFAARTGRRQRGGAVRYTNGVVTLVTREEPGRMVVLTVYQTPHPVRRTRRPHVSDFPQDPHPDRHEAAALG
jgi:hypothetical protein